jgi:hypothetical protein
MRAVLLLGLLAALNAFAADIDRSAVDFKAPTDIKWVRNAVGTNEPGGSARERSSIPSRGPGREKAGA